MLERGDRVSQDRVIERVPPQSLEAEQSTLGSMLIDRDAVAKAMEYVTADDFYREAHRLIFTGICNLFERGEPVDIITLTEELRGRGQLDNAGGVAYLTTLMNIVPTSANIEYYARIVGRKSVLRHLISAATKIVAMGYEDVEDPDPIVDTAEQLIFNVGQRRHVQNFYPIKDIIRDSFDQIDKQYHEKGASGGVPTGFSELDRMTSGFHPSDLIIIAARPAMGKTSFALNIACNVARDSKQPVAVFSLEMSKEQLVHRLLCSEAMVDSYRLRTGYLSDDDWPKLARAIGRLSEMPIYIDDTSAISVLEMRAKARRLKAEQGLGMIVIDFLQLARGNQRTDNRVQEISEIVRSLKSLARELNIPVVALSQLSRAVEKRDEKTPMLSDLRESGELEQTADLVLFIYREDYYNREDEPTNIARITLAKHRHGPVGELNLCFRAEYTKFENLEEHMEEPNAFDSY